MSEMKRFDDKEVVEKNKRIEEETLKTIKRTKIKVTKAVRLAVLLLGEKSSEEIIEQQASDFVAGMDSDALDRALVRFEDTKELYESEEEEKECGEKEAVEPVVVAKTHFHINNGGVSVKVVDNPEYGVELKFEADHMGNTTNSTKIYTNVDSIRHLAVEMLKASCYKYSGEEYCGSAKLYEMSKLESIDWEEIEEVVSDLDVVGVVDDKDISENEALRGILVNRLAKVVVDFNKEVEDAIANHKVETIWDDHFVCIECGNDFGGKSSGGFGDEDKEFVINTRRECWDCKIEYGEKDGKNYKRKSAELIQEPKDDESGLKSTGWLKEYEWEEFEIK